MVDDYPPSHVNNQRRATEPPFVFFVSSLFRQGLTIRTLPLSSPDLASPLVVDDYPPSHVSNQRRAMEPCFGLCTQVSS